MIRHLNKQADVGKAMYRGNGSIGLLAACRAGFLVASEDGNEDLRLLACVKSNLAKKPPTLRFAIRSVRPNCANKGVEEVPAVEWLGTSELKADELLAETGGQVKAAKDFLLEFLAEGPKGSSEVEESAKASDIALSTLKRARKILRVEKRIRSTKDGPGGTWMIRLLDAPGAGQAGVRSLDAVDLHETLDPDEPLTSHQHTEPPLPVSQEVQESQEVQGDQQSQGDTVAN